MRYLMEATLVALFLAGVAACDDGVEGDSDGDVDCDLPADQWRPECADGGDADTDGDSDGDVLPTKIDLSVDTFTWIRNEANEVVEEPLPGARAILHSGGELSCSPTPCVLQGVTVGVPHELTLELAGRVQEPVHIVVTQDGNVELRETNPAFASAIVLIADRTISVRLERDLTGTWQDEDGDETEIAMYPPRAESEGMCPNSALLAGRFFSPTALCVEGDSLSLCSTYEQVCYEGIGVVVQEGAIEGDQITFTGCDIYDPEACGERTYTRVD